MFFFFRQKTAYEWRISDWSSDVCSSDRVMPIDRTGEDRPSLFVGWIDALPVPAALIRPLARGNFSLHASNGAFDRLELAPADARAPIEMRRAIVRAARQQGEAQEFSCLLGEGPAARSEGHKSEIQSQMRITNAVFIFKNNKYHTTKQTYK